jgi:hypothetical protein
MVLPCRPCRAGRQPVAIDADEERVTEGNTLRWEANQRARAFNAQMFGVRSSEIRSRRIPSQMTTTARREVGMVSLSGQEYGGAQLTQETG